MYLFQHASELCDIGEINKCISSTKSDRKGMSNKGTHSVDDTLEEIKRHGTYATRICIELSRWSVHPIRILIIQYVVGIVALLGKA